MIEDKNSRILWQIHFELVAWMLAWCGLWSGAKNRDTQLLCNCHHTYIQGYTLPVRRLTDATFSHLAAVCYPNTTNMMWSICLRAFDSIQYIYSRWIQLIYVFINRSCVELGNYFILFHILFFLRPNDNSNWLKQHPISMPMPVYIHR